MNNSKNLLVLHPDINRFYETLGLFLYLLCALWSNVEKLYTYTLGFALLFHMISSVEFAIKTLLISSIATHQKMTNNTCTVELSLSL